MRFLLSAIIVAGAIASGTVASLAQQGCTNRGVTKGYMLTGHGRRGSCCQNVSGAGVCSLKTCKVGTSPGYLHPDCHDISTANHFHGQSAELKSFNTKLNRPGDKTSVTGHDPKSIHHTAGAPP